MLVPARQNTQVGKLGVTWSIDDNGLLCSRRVRKGEDDWEGKSDWERREGSEGDLEGRG